MGARACGRRGVCAGMVDIYRSLVFCSPSCVIGRGVEKDPVGVRGIHRCYPLFVIVLNVLSRFTCQSLFGISTSCRSHQAGWYSWLLRSIPCCYCCLVCIGPGRSRRIGVNHAILCYYCLSYQKQGTGQEMQQKRVDMAYQREDTFGIRMQVTVQKVCRFVTTSLGRTHHNEYDVPLVALSLSHQQHC